MKDRFTMLVIGAHPDDAEIQAGGIALLYARAGHRVGFVSMTNGDAGHHEQGGTVLAGRRLAESICAAQVAGIESGVMDIHDGELEPCLENRKQLIRLIRAFRPNVIITHRANDYHPDHRYTSVLVQDASFMVTVPKVCPDSPHMPFSPVVLFMSDHFKKPVPFQAALAVGIDSVIAGKMDMLHCHTSQVYEFLPYSRGYLDEVPGEESRRRAWLEKLWLPDSDAAKWREMLVKLYGEERGRAFRYAEAFEASEHGAPLDSYTMDRLFSFLFRD